MNPYIINAYQKNTSPKPQVIRTTTTVPTPYVQQQPVVVTQRPTKIVVMTPEQLKMQNEYNMMVFKWVAIAIAIVAVITIPVALLTKKKFGTEEQLTQEEVDAAKRKFYMLVVVYFIWIIMGISAFIWSLVCFGRSGSTGSKFGGLLLAILFGPFYWIYYIFNKSYCRKK